MIERIIIAGYGGQGIMLIGKVLASAAMSEGRETTWFPSYGPEVRGGTAHCMVNISDATIGSPVINKADILVILNNQSMEKFKKRIKDKGLLVVNSSFAGLDLEIKNITVLKHPFTDIAVRLGNVKVANMVALGCLVAHKKIVQPETIIQTINEFAPRGKNDLIEINVKALKEGLKLK